MTSFTQIKFDMKDVIKLIGFVGFIGSMWYDLKSEQVKAAEQRAFLQYQINEIRAVATRQEPPSIKTYRYNTTR